MQEKHGPAAGDGAGGSPAPAKTEAGGSVGGHTDSDAVVIDTGDGKDRGDGEQKPQEDGGGASDYLVCPPSDVE